mgnify:CR=1 FL=1
MRRVIVWEAINTQYDVLNYFARGLASGLRALGWSVLEVPLSDPAALRDVWETLEELRPDLVVGFNGVGPIINGVDPVDAAGITQVLWLVDHPVYHLLRIGLRKSAIVGCVDLSHEDYMETVFSGCPTLFLPHGVNTELAEGLEEERSFSIVLAGSYRDPDRIRCEWEQRLPPNLSRLLDDIAQTAVFSDLPLHHHVRNVLRQVLSDDRHAEMARFEAVVLPYVDKYVRNVRRRLVVKALRGRTIHVFGNGDWAMLNDDGGLRLHGAVDFREMARVFRRTKVVVNVLPWFTHGSHERPMLAAYAGAMVLSDRSVWLQHELPQISTFSWEKFDADELATKVAELLSVDRESWEERTSSAREIIQQYHSWAARARLLSEMFCGSR